MSLSSAISTAQTIFSNTGLQSAALSKNIANASNPDYARRVGVLTIDSAGGQQLSIQRTYDNGLVKQTMYSTAESSAQETLQQKLERIRSLLGGNDYETSPSTYIATLRDNLQAYATKPNESTLASTVISSAKDVSNSLNSISSEIQSMRGSIDQEIQDKLEELRGLLKQFENVNNAIKAGTATGSDVNNELDMRERYLKDISKIVGIRSFTRGDNDMVLYTSDGTMLFDVNARDIMFTPNAAFDAATLGNPVIIDGVTMTAGVNGNTTGRGSLQALLQVRDDIIPTYQTQLDETARGLIEIFAQQDQSASGLDPLPGLFTWKGYAAGDSLPASGSLTGGLASLIKVNDSLVKSLTGGNPTLLRDGGYDVDGLGVADAAYLGNTSNDASYSQILDALVGNFETDIAFDTGAMLDTSTTIADFSTGSVGWLEQYISESSKASDNKAAQLARVTEALSNTTGVSLDEEMSLMLDLEQSYKASSKLVSAVDQMIDSLLQAV
ncbi:flagellar hook-associated protein FlgK [Rhizobium sp. KVB221]|uniref:Flagellar hook-associated protein 1 n=1 Tax=Rhizobium setariae TaxID=2801340 RepID=A0A936YI58_9HYPH|nr:flagellar hook-associated protein FlgK [Rhizobium setariae]MBL0370694.1 flagellar hook-associated protein FlgK [Rhizobium setariae]